MKEEKYLCWMKILTKICIHSFNHKCWPGETYSRIFIEMKEAIIWDLISEINEYFILYTSYHNHLRRKLMWQLILFQNCFIQFTYYIKSLSLFKKRKGIKNDKCSFSFVFIIQTYLKIKLSVLIICCFLLQILISP